MGLLITLLLGVFILLGALVATISKDRHRAHEISTAVALGAMAMLLVQDLGPEAVEATEAIGYPLAIGAMVLGFVALLVLDRFLPEAEHAHSGSHHTDTSCDHEDVLHISIVATLAIAIHNVVEGMSVCGIASASVSTALLLAIGVGIHNIPMGMLIYDGVRDERRPRKIIILGIAALSTFVGGILMAILSQSVNEAAVLFVVCLTIGLLLYIIVMELIPYAFRSHHKGATVLCVLIGAALVLVSSFLG